MKSPKLAAVFIAIAIATQSCFSDACFGQTQKMKLENRLKVDSLLKKLPFLSDSPRVDCLNGLFLPYKRIGEKDSAVFYTKKAYNEAIHINYIKGIAEALTNKAYSETVFNANYEDGEKLAREALGLYEKTRNKGGIAWTYFNLGESLCYLSFFSKASDYFKEAFYWYKKTGNHLGMFSTLRSWGCNYEESGDYENAFECYRQALELAKETDNDLLIRDGLKHMGVLYRAIEDYPTAISYFRQALQNTNPQERHGFYMEVAELFSLSHQYDSARYYFNQLDTSNSDYLAIHHGYQTVKGEYFLFQKEYGKALQYFQRALNYYKQHNDRNGFTRTILDIAKTYLALENTDLALPYARQGLSLARQAHSNKYIRDAVNTLYVIYDRKKQVDSAYLYYRQYNVLNDSILNDQLKARFAIYGPEQKIELLNKENEIQQAKLQKQTFQKNILMAGILVLLLLSVLVFRYILLRRKDEKHQRDIAESELHIQKLESERTKAELQRQANNLEMQALRAQMNPHFIFNCLSSINRFILKNESEPASDYLTKFSRLIRMVLNKSKETFITLEDELEMLGLYLEMERLRFAYAFDYNISFKNEIEPENIFIPPMLLQPFAENAIWHGLMHKQGQGHIEIELSLREKILTCIITDNGIGRSKAGSIKSKSTEKQKSMGLQITTERLALLNHDSNVRTFFTIEDLTDDHGQPAGTQVIFKIHYRDMLEVQVQV